MSARWLKLCWLVNERGTAASKSRYRLFSRTFLCSTSRTVQSHRLCRSQTGRIRGGHNLGRRICRLPNQQAPSLPLTRPHADTSEKATGMIRVRGGQLC